MSKKLTKKEAEFCCLAAKFGNSTEAAYKAGFTVLPQIKAERMLKRREITEEIEKIKKQLAKNEEALTGLRRLAFGSVADAVGLALSGESTPDVPSLDLYCVSEIKYTAGKGVELKFYDRLKALEKLAELESAREGGGTLSFYEALERSAKKAYGND